MAPIPATVTEADLRFQNAIAAGILLETLFLQALALA